MFDRQKRAVVSALNLPEDVMLGDMFLSFTGNRGVLIENYRNIILYTDTVPVSYTHLDVYKRQVLNRALTKERLIKWGFYDLATAYQSMHVNY